VTAKKNGERRGRDCIGPRKGTLIYDVGLDNTASGKENILAISLSPWLLTSQPCKFSLIRAINGRWLVSTIPNALCRVKSGKASACGRHDKAPFSLGMARGS
jgi:hypothetical protein